MPDPVVEFFTEKEWYDQDEISRNKRLAVREFYEWLQGRPTQDAPDLGESSASDSESTPAPSG